MNPTRMSSSGKATRDNIFVTGASGMLGNYICRELLGRNYKVKAFCLDSKAVHTLDGLGIEITYGNILDRKVLAEAMRDCRFVIHIAALTNVWPRRCEMVKRVNIEGTKNVLEAAKENNVERMIHIGSASSFRYGSKAAPGNESCSYDGWKYGMDYIDSKYVTQKILIEENRQSGFPVVIINPTFMIGGFDYVPTSGKMIRGLVDGNIPGYSKGGKNFVCASDVAVATVNALTMGKPGECYIAGNQNLSYKEFFTIASAAMQRDFTLKALPCWLVLLAGAIGSVSARIKRGAPFLSYGMASLGIIDQYFSAEKAMRELKMPQTTIEIGIKQSINWFKQNGHLK